MHTQWYIGIIKGYRLNDLLAYLFNSKSEILSEDRTPNMVSV